MYVVTSSNSAKVKNNLNPTQILIRLVFQVVFDRQRNGTGLISKDTMISALFF